VNTRTAKLFPAILVGIFATLRVVDSTPPSASIAGAANKMTSRVTDLTQIAEGLKGRDGQLAIDFGNVAAENRDALHHLQDLLLIESLIQNESDRRKVEPVISNRIENLARHIDRCVEVINRGMPLVHNQALIATAMKLKDDLRELKELLQR
jgi:hypothetical protein